MPHLRPHFMFALMLSLVVGCSDSNGGDDTGGSGDGGSSRDGGVGDGAVGDGSTVDAPASDGPIIVRDGEVVIREDGGGSWSCFVTSCAGHVLECGDCEDNDGDGVVDSHDPECLGACDNTEGPALTAGIGGETGGPCKADCYFDFGNGSGGGDCVWDHRCDPRSVGPHYDPEGMSCEYEESRVGSRDCPDVQPANCEDICKPLTPNGCDCFGCCTFPQLEGRSEAEGGEFVWLGSVIEGTNTGTCTFDDILNRELCRPCTPVANCFNPCGDCELCLGRTTLPDECFPPPDGGVGDAGAGDGGAVTDGGGTVTDGGGTVTDGGGTVTDGGVLLDSGTRDGGALLDSGARDAGPDLNTSRCSPGIQPCGLPIDPECPADFYCITGCCQAILL